MKIPHWLVLVLLFMISACSGSNGRLSLSLSDAAIDDYSAVYVTIDRVEVNRLDSESDPDDESWETVFIPEATYNLLELVNGVRSELGMASLTAGEYSQMRLILGTTPDDSINILSQSHEFAHYVIDADDNEVHELTVPSGYQTGIKIVTGFTISEAETTELILDFDAAQSVVVAGNSGNYLLKPTIRILDQAEYAVVTGTVSDADSAVVISGALMSLQQYDAAASDPKDEVVVSSATLTSDLGEYALFVAPDTYNIVATAGGYVAEALAITLAAGDAIADTNFALATSATGTVAGSVTIDGADDETYATLSFRQSLSVDDEIVVVEVLSVNIANGGSYTETLAVGTYDLVTSSAGKTTQEATVVVTDGATVTTDVSL